MTIVAIFATFLSVVAGCARANPDLPAPKSQLRKFEFVREKMGGPFRVALYAADQVSADRAADAAYARVDQLNRILSDYLPDSEISRLSQRTNNGPIEVPVPVSEDLFRVLTRAQEMAGQSNGAFDVTVGPFVRLWKRAREMHELPTEQRLEQTRPSVGYRNVRLDAQRRTVQLLAPRMRLDVGGLAIGYITDQAVAAASAAGAPAVLVDGGGEISAGDPCADPASPPPATRGGSSRSKVRATRTSSTRARGWG
jgi:thiamine biosynthesis lipoprotein